jgi:hypothetical protein
VRWKLVWEFVEEHRWEPPGVQPSLLALAYDASRVTRDVDARFVPHGIVLDELVFPGW